MNPSPRFNNDQLRVDLISSKSLLTPLPPTQIILNQIPYITPLFLKYQESLLIKGILYKMKPLYRQSVGMF